MTDLAEYRIAAVTDDARSDLNRTDNKAGLLLQLAFGVIGVLGTAGATIHPPTAALLVGGAAAGLAGAAVWLLTEVVMPRLGDRRTGWPAYAGLTGEQVRQRAADADGDDATQLGYLAGLTTRKHQRIIAAIWLLRAAAPLGLAAALITALA